MQTKVLDKKNVMLMVTVLLVVAAVVGFAAGEANATSVENVLEQQLEKQEEFRFWEIRTELHRIHHHLEFMPIMVWTHIGIFLALVALVILKFQELKKK